MADNGNVLTFRSEETIDAEAAAWLVRLDRGDLTDAERLALRRWLAEDARHVVALESNLSVWEDFDELARDLILAHAAPRQDDRRRRGAVFAPIAYVLSGLAVAAFAAFMFVPSFVSDRMPEDFTLALETGLGEHKTVSLPDASEASLNSDTLAEFEYTATQRHVHLIRGEARFQVAHDPDRAFAVLANGRIIEAVGTAFVVKIGDGQTLVSVSEGRVRVAAAAAATAAGDPFDVVGTSGAGRRILHSGEELVFAPAHAQVEVRQFDPSAFQRRLAWTDGRMVFDGERLQDVIEEFARHSEITIELSKPAFADLKVTGNFVLGDVEAFLEAIEITLGIQAERLPGNRVLLATAAE